VGVSYISADAGRASPSCWGANTWAGIRQQG